MSWQLASLLVLALALGGGFAWYERSRPPAEMLAVVATLAGLAAVGRIAFAPVPSIKPTTDIVLLSGFALGGAPGFAVGAVGALTSNMFFGQGPWTPWQMLGWGLVGLGGAALGRVTRRRAPRWALAIACGFAGFAFLTFIDASTWIMYSGAERSWAQFVALKTTAAPFDVAQVVGNVVFALAFGPGFVRALLRFRTRLEVRWSEPPPAPVVVAPVPSVTR